MDFTIRLKAEGADEARALADSVKAFGVEYAKVQDALKLQVKQGGLGPTGKPGAAPKPTTPKPAPADDGAKAAAKAKADALRAAKEADRQEAERIDPEMRKSQADKAKERVAKRQSTAAKNEAKAAEKAEIAKIDPRSAMSAIDKAKERVAKQKEGDAKKADKDKAEKIDPSQKMSATQKVVNEKLYKPLMIGAAVVGASLVGAMAKFAPLALGYQGMARLSMISMQASFNMRRLFHGTNPKPLLDAIQRTSQEILDPRTMGGQALGGLLRRTSDSVMASLAKLEPYARAFFKGMILGGMQVENAWLKLRIAIQPALNLLPKAGLDMLALRSGALLVTGAFSVMGLGVGISAVKAAGAMLTFGRAAVAATGPLLPAIVAITAWTTAIKGAIEIYEQWDESTAWQIGNQLRADLGIDSKEENEAAMNARMGIVTGDAYDKKHGLGKYAKPEQAATTGSVKGAEKPAQMPPPSPPKGAEKQAKPVGQAIGTNLGLGVVEGMKATQGQVENGARDLVLAGEKGAKNAGEIRSPSRKWKKQIGQMLGEGAALGLEASAGRMSDAAAAIVPDAPEMGMGGAARGKVVIQQIGPFFGMPSGGEAQVRRWVFDALDDAAERLGALAAVGG